MNLLFYLIPVLLLCIIAFSVHQQIDASTSNRIIFPSDSTLHNTTHKEWVANWWKWWTSIPSDLHPGENQSDAKRCAAMQNGPVWFLPDVHLKKMNYECSVPLGKDIMLPISTTECESGGIEMQMSDEDLKQCGSNIEKVVMQVFVDGINVNASNSVPGIQTDFFNVTYPENPTTIWGEGAVKPGTYRAVAYGYFLFLHDLPAGKHNIELDVSEKLKEEREFIERVGNFEIFVE